MRKLLKIAGWSVMAALVALAAVVASDITFWKRLVTAPVSDMATAVDWYRPLETVPGSATARWAVSSDATLQEATQEALLEYGTATESVAMLIWHDGQIVFEHYWPGYGESTLTDPASMHKTVMAMLVGIAIEDGLIDSVNAKASTWLTEWQNDPRNEISVEQLLQMASGLELVPFDPNPFGQYFRTLLGTDIEPVFLNVPAEKGPGSEFAYSNVNAQVLGILVQRAAGVRYAEYLSAALWSKLGVGDSYLWLDDEGGMPRTFCCQQTHARGWLRVGQLFVTGGVLDGVQVVPVEWLEQMTTPSPTNPNYGYQVWLGTEFVAERVYNPTVAVTAHHSEPFLAEDVIYLDGFGGQRVYAIPSRNLVIVRTGVPQLDWDDARLPNTVLRDPSFSNGPS